MASQIDGIKLPKNKPYGSLPLGDGFQIGFHARKDHLSIHFRSEKIKANKVFNWINKNGLMGKNIAGDYILQPMPGKRNPNVVTAELHIPYDSKDELSNNDLRNKAVELFNMLKSEFGEIVSSF